MPFMMTQGQSGTAVPYYRSGTLAGLTLAATSPVDSARLRRYEEGWRFYQGQHWNFARENGEPLVTANYARAIVAKKASWLAGNGMTITVPEALDHLTKPDLDEVWDYNGLQPKLMEIAITGGCTGDVFLVPQYEAPSQAELNENPFVEGRIRIRVVMPHQAFPEVDPLNRERFTSFKIITEIADIENRTHNRSTFGLILPHVTRGEGRKRFVEEITTSAIARGWEGSEPSMESNMLGEIPVVHIRNEVFPGETYGMSDLDGLVDLQRELNEKLTDVSDMVNYHANPVTIITGAIARTLEKSPKAIWSIKEPSAKVFNLASVSDLGAAKEFADTIKMMMFDISGVPEGSLGRQQQISNTGEAALLIQFGPLVEATGRKSPNYEQGIEKLNRLILLYRQVIRGRKYPIDICGNCGGRVTEKYEDGSDVPVRRCFHVNKQTMDFLSPDDYLVNWRREMSFGSDLVQMRYGDVKKLMSGEKPTPSYWDPKPEALEEQDEHDDMMEDHQIEVMTTPPDPPPAPPPKPLKPGEKLPPAPPAAPPKEIPAPPKKPKIKVPQLAESEVDLPAEPESGKGYYIRKWNPSTRAFTLSDMGDRQVVFTGCDRPRPVSPFTNKVKLNNALPKDLAVESNQLASWQNSGWISGAEARRRLPISTTARQLDKEILDDIAVMAKREEAAAGAKAAKADNGGKAAEAAAGVKGTNPDATAGKKPPQPGQEG